MRNDRLPDYLDHIRKATIEACGFVEGLAKEDDAQLPANSGGQTADGSIGGTEATSRWV